MDKKTLIPALALGLGLLTSPAMAAGQGPVTLTDLQMDRLTAGQRANDNSNSNVNQTRVTNTSTNTNTNAAVSSSTSTATGIEATVPVEVLGALLGILL